MQDTIKNRTIFCRDNIEILRRIDSKTIDLIYLDPPFNKNKSFYAPIGSKAEGASFRDTWYEGDIKNEQLDLLIEKHPNIYSFIHGITGIRGQNKTDRNYLIYMAVRLIEMHRILKDTGSLYLHCDQTMSHFLKILLDCIFGGNNFRNEIVWMYRKWTNATNYFQRNHDILLFYSKSGNIHFNKIYGEPAKSQLEVINKGWNVNKVKKGLQLLIYNKEKYEIAVKQKIIDINKYCNIIDKTNTAGTALNDNWDIQFLHSQSKERLGYPTQKPIALLERIIKASSNKGDLILDPFCGCATTCVAAEKLERKWVGIDVSDKAFELVQLRLDSIKDELPTDGSITSKKLFFRKDIPTRTDLGKIKKYNHPDNKKHLYGAQAGNCNGCETHFEIIHLEVDHIISRDSGGGDELDNLQLLCGNCNKTKGAHSMEYLKQKLNTRGKNTIYKHSI